jgi:hypothetical protein
MCVIVKKKGRVYLLQRQWAGPSLPQMHKDLITSERGGPSPYRSVEPWLLLLLLLLYIYLLQNAWSLFSIVSVIGLMMAP